jgi:hypothetical protein
MNPIRVTIHPKDVPAGYEAEAVYRAPNANEHTVSGGGLQKTSMLAEPYFIPRLILTPKRPSLAQRVKDSGWRCPIWAESLECKRFFSGNTNWSVRITEGDYMTLRPDPLLGMVEITEEDYGVIVKVNANGYPIVEEENQ